MTKLGVVIPVGPQEHHARWLAECLQSIREQTRNADYLVVVDDMHGIEKLPVFAAPLGEVWRSPWLLGVPHAFNIGLARAFARGCNLVLMQGADDTLSPDALEHLERSYEQNGSADGYYWFDVHYSDGEEQRLPCNAAAVTPGLWRMTGGFPPESAVGACDHIFISRLLAQAPQSLVHVGGGYIWHRRHEHQETARQGGIAACRSIVRDWYAERWRPPTWGRLA